MKQVWVCNHDLSHSQFSNYIPYKKFNEYNMANNNFEAINMKIRNQHSKSDANTWYLYMEQNMT